MTPRHRQCLNRDWRFHRGDLAGAEAPAVADAAWEHVGLPHSFDLPYFRTPEFYVGCGWYRRAFDVPPEWRGRRVHVEFEGAFQGAAVFVNGRPVGRHRGGYTGFAFDVTDACRTGANLLAVRVNNEWDPQLAPRAGEHVFPGGIYRDVYLTVTAPLHVAHDGTFVTTPVVSRVSAVVQVEVEVRNASPDAAECVVRSEVLDPEGRTVATGESPLAVAAESVAAVAQRTQTVVNPRLWHPDHPTLYTVRTTVAADGAVVDSVLSPLGFRWFEWTADRGFFLNGEHLYLRGANAHQDHAGWGIAITQAACRRDVQLIKGAGFNFVRGAHYPHHRAFARACDELGVLFWSENCFWGKGGFGPEGYWNASAYPADPNDFAGFDASANQAVAEMIRANRNHPSIVAWSMTNEAFFTYHVEQAKRLVVELVELSRALDPTRPAAVGGAQRGGFDVLGDVAGYNGDGARLFLDPGVPNMVSEYGAIGKPHDAYDPFHGDLQPERFAWRSGEAIWCGFDYGSIAGRQGLKGIIDHYRVPKRSWHWYRNANLGIAPPPPPTDAPPAALRLTADKTTIAGTDAIDDCQLTVTVVDAAGEPASASPPVTLTIIDGPGQFPTGRSVTFDNATDVKITAGQAAMAFRSYHGGVSTIVATSPGLASATLHITTTGEPTFVPGRTPIPPDRGYRPPDVSDAARRATENVVNVARDRPSRVSSELPDHPARAANDGAADTTWTASADDVRPWWRVDLEGYYQISGSRITFPGEGNWRFVVELSDDGVAWATAVDRTGSVNTAPVRNDIYPPGATARYVRVTLACAPHSQPPGLRDVEVYGILSTR